MEVVNEYEGKVVLVTGGAKPFFPKESFTKEICFLVKVFAKQKSSFLSTGSFFRKKVYIYKGKK
jgi:hypothetical protein